MHTTDSPDGRFSKSRDIAAHNGALRPNFAPSLSPFPPFPARDCNIPHGVGRGGGRPWHTRYRRACDKKAPGRTRSSLSLLLLVASPRRRSVEHEIRSPPSPPSPFRMRTGSGKHGESPRRDSGHVGGIYSRGGRSRMAPCSSPSEFPGAEFCRFREADTRLVVRRRFLLRSRLLPPPPAPSSASIDGDLNALAYRPVASSARPKSLTPFDGARRTSCPLISPSLIPPRFRPLCQMDHNLP